MLYFYFERLAKNGRKTKREFWGGEVSLKRQLKKYCETKNIK